MVRYSCVVVMLLASFVAGPGCSGDASEVTEFQQVSSEELLPTLRQVEATGEYEAVLPGLSTALEQEGLVNEAARIQSFTELPPEQVKKLAGAIANEVEKARKANP